MTEKYMVNEMNGARERKQVAKAYTINTFSHAETLVYKKEKVRNPEINTAHSQRSELTRQSIWNDHGGVSARTTRGTVAMSGMSFFISSLNWCGVVYRHPAMRVLY